MLPFPFMCKGPPQDECPEFSASDHGCRARKVVHFALAATGRLTHYRTLSTFHIKALACCLLWVVGEIDSTECRLHVADVLWKKYPTFMPDFDILSEVHVRRELVAFLIRLSIKQYTVSP